MPWIAERLLREDSILRRGRWAWIVGLVPLLFANIVGALVLLVALGVWAIGRSAPSLMEAWRSQVVTWLGRAALVAVALASGARPRPRRDRHPRLTVQEGWFDGVPGVVVAERLGPSSFRKMRRLLTSRAGTYMVTMTQFTPSG